MTDWWIRSGEPGDVPRLAAVERAADRLFPAGRLPPGDDPYPLDQLADACAAGLLFVAARQPARARDEIIGFGFCRIEGRRLHLVGLAVDPDHGRQGIGAALVRRAWAECRARALEGVTLTTFADLSWNGPFYARMGFSVLDEPALPTYLATALARERAAGMRDRVAMQWTSGVAPAPRLLAVRADITTLAVDAIVNAANSALGDGAGVNGAIQRAAGPALLMACHRLGGCATGDAKLTPGFRLPARAVIHAVGPVWQGGTHGEPALLAGCYRRAIGIAARDGLRSIAFPCISTGIYGYPFEAAARIAVGTVRAALPAGLVEEVIFCCFAEPDLAVYRALL
ncbi:MAG: O-acetyl-ADP-ribose deacetylase [Pseudomonadales bacterium]|nr:O-acetyl-ADP-ribose deacetylase [Pseudomonadales bacterium]